MAIYTNKKICFVTICFFVVFGLVVFLQISSMSKKLPFSRKLNLVIRKRNEINGTMKLNPHYCPTCDTSSKSEIEKDNNEAGFISISKDLNIGYIKLPQPAFRLGKVAQNAEILIGIPTIKRDKESYLMTTLSSLIENHGFNSSFGIVIFIAETNLDYVKQTSEEIQFKFGDEIQRGIIEIISPPESFYPNWKTSLESSFGDSMKQVKWRSKENLDAMYLMLYIYQQNPKYYLMLEDDIIATRNYLKILYEKTNERKSDYSWFMLSFSQFGSIGKVFRRSIIPSYAQFTAIYWNRKPIDWLLEEYAAVKYCSFLDSNSCKKVKKNHILRIPPSLFQHIGRYSSLNSRVRNEKANDFIEG